MLDDRHSEEEEGVEGVEGGGTDLQVVCRQPDILQVVLQHVNTSVFVFVIQQV